MWVSIVGVAPSFREIHKHSPGKHSKLVKEVKRRRDREQSRIPVKKIINSMKKRKARCKLKFILKPSNQLPSIVKYNQPSYSVIAISQHNTICKCAIN